MNYIKQLNAFYDYLPINPLSTNAISLYGALLHINNKCNWQTVFSAALLTLRTFTGLNKQAIERARNELVQKKYIKFKKGSNQYSAGRYEIIDLQRFNSTENDIPNDTALDIANDTTNNAPNDIPNNTANDTINKLKHKQIKKEKKENIAREEKSFDEMIEEYTNNENLQRELKNHLAIRKRKGALTIRALELGLHNLSALTNKISSEDEKVKIKIEIVQQSIRGGYPEFYPLKNQKKQGGINYNYTQRKQDEAILEQLYEN